MNFVFLANGFAIIVNGAQVAVYEPHLERGVSATAPYNQNEPAPRNGHMSAKHVEVTINQPGCTDAKDTVIVEWTELRNIDLNIASCAQPDWYELATSLPSV